MDSSVIAIIMASLALALLVLGFIYLIWRLKGLRHEFLEEIEELKKSPGEQVPLLRNHGSVEAGEFRGAQSTQRAMAGPGASHPAKGHTQADLIEAEEEFLKEREEKWRDVDKDLGAQSTQRAMAGPGASHPAKGHTQADLIEKEEEFLKEREEKWRDVDKDRGAQSTQRAMAGPGASHPAKRPTQADLIEAEEEFLKEREEKWRDMDKTRGCQPLLRQTQM